MCRGSAETPQYTGSRGLQTSKKPWSHDWPRPETTVRPHCSYCSYFLSSSLPLSRPTATLFWATTCAVALTLLLHYFILLYIHHSSFPFAFPYFRAGTTLTFIIVIPPATTRPSVTPQLFHSAYHHLIAHITHACHWLANSPSTNTKPYPGIPRLSAPSAAMSSPENQQQHPNPAPPSVSAGDHHDLPHNQNHT
jgi:hypothetical protein